MRSTNTIGLAIVGGTVAFLLIIFACPELANPAAFATASAATAPAPLENPTVVVLNAPLETDHSLSFDVTVVLINNTNDYVPFNGVIYLSSDEWRGHDPVVVTHGTEVYWEECNLAIKGCKLSWKGFIKAKDSVIFRLPVMGPLRDGEVVNTEVTINIDGRTFLGTKTTTMK